MDARVGVRTRTAAAAVPTRPAVLWEINGSGGSNSSACPWPAGGQAGGQAGGRALSRRQGAVCVRWIYICLDTSARSEPSYWAYQALAAHVWHVSQTHASHTRLSRTARTPNV